MKKRVACYVRVSTVGQNETGQHNDLQKWITGNGIPTTMVDWYVDKVSGDTLARPAFDRLQRDIFTGNVATVVVWRLDRLSRKVRDGINVLCDWCELDLRIVSVTQQIDFKGPTGKMLAAVLLGVAEMEQEARRERQRVGIEAAKERGLYSGRKQGTTKAKPKRAHQLRDKGLTGREIATAMGISPRTVDRYLKMRI